MVWEMRIKQEYICPVELTLDCLKGKWKPIILAILKEKPRKYGELRQLIQNISDKILTQRLNELIKLGLIEKTANPNQYALTANGQTLSGALQALYDWGGNFALNQNPKPKFSINLIEGRNDS